MEKINTKIQRKNNGKNNRISEEASNLSEEELKQEETVKGLSDLKELSQEILWTIVK